MIEVVANPLLGITLHAAGALSAALCYTPQRKLRGWSWQTYGLVQAAFCWFLLPVLGAVLTIPNLSGVLAEAPRRAMLLTFALGVAYGVGGTSFGLAIKKIGFSLTYAIAIGVSCILGTLTGPLIKGELGSIMDKPGSGWVMIGVLVGLIGTLLCGLTGRMKEIEIQKDADEKQPFDLTAGLLLCGVAGVLSAVYGTAHVRMGAFKFSSWAIHMIMLILLSAMSGVVMKEWHGRTTRTKRAISFAVLVLIASVLVITVGNYIGQQTAGH